jgi:hypothetical protein
MKWMDKGFLHVTRKKPFPMSLAAEIELCIAPLDLKTMGFFSVPRLPGWSFQHPSTSHFKKVHRLFGDGENRRVFQRSQIEGKAVGFS